MAKKLITADKACFDEIVNLLESNENTVRGKRWLCNKEGYHTYMTQPLDLKLILKHYTPTDEVVINNDYGWIRTTREWLTICHSNSE